MKKTSQQLATAMILKWRDRLWLGAWSPSIEMVPSIGKTVWERESVAAQCDADPAYKTATIQFSEQLWAKRSLGKSNRSACHEMCHVALAEMSQYVDTLTSELSREKRPMFKKWWREVNERTTQHWTNVMLDVFNELKDTGE